MELFREEYLTIQDDYLRVDPSREEESDEEVDYSNDDLGENTEITPLGDAIEEDEVNDLKIDPDDEDYGDDEDIDVDSDEDIDDEEGFVDISSQVDPDDEDDLEDDDDLLADDDDLDTTLDPDLDDDDDLLADDDDDLLADDEDEFDEDTTARTSIDTTADFSSRPHGRVTGTMLDHEPGLPGSGRI